MATGIDCPKKVYNVENIISDINLTLEKNNTEKKLNLEKNESINNNDNIISEPTDNIDLKEETLNKVDVQETINISQESFIPPEPEVIEKEQIQEEVKIDPFTEAEVLNASANIKEEKINDTEPQEKQ